MVQGLLYLYLDTYIVSQGHSSICLMGYYNSNSLYFTLLSLIENIRVNVTIYYV